MIDPDFANSVKMGMKDVMTQTSKIELSKKPFYCLAHWKIYLIENAFDK
jgi:hypothetical protein